MNDLLNNEGEVISRCIRSRRLRLNAISFFILIYLIHEIKQFMIDGQNDMHQNLLK